MRRVVKSLGWSHAQFAVLFQTDWEYNLRQVRVERKLTAILCADVHGYSRLMGEDEEATLRSLSSHRTVIDGLIEQHRGRFVNSAGDSVLAEFASVVNAVQCGVAIQIALKSENATLPPERRMQFRIGINLGDVIVEGEQIYGDGVNVAARLESLAEPGGICISGTVHEQIGDKLVLGYEDLGEQAVKNIARPVRVLRVLADPGTAAAQTASRKKAQATQRYLRRGAWSIAGLAIIVGTIVIVQHVSLRPPVTTASIPPAQTPALPLPDKPSIAVLPFANMSGDPQQEYFSDGITDDLIIALARLPGLFVIARTFTFTYKGKPVKVQEVGRELGVRYVLEGSVHKAGNQVRITAQLVDATTGAEAWAERYDRPLRDIFSLQDEIVRKIVTTTNLQLTLLEAGIPAGERPDNVEAYDDYLRGEEYTLSNLTRERNEKARQMFEKAIELDPKYAAAYGALGFAYFLDMNNQWSRDPHVLDRAFQLEQQALSLDESNGAAYEGLSQLYLGKRQFDQAVGAAERAVAVDPSSSSSYAFLAISLALSGKPAEALKVVEKARRLDPRMQDSSLNLLAEGIAYNVMGRYQEAIPVLKRYVPRNPNFLMAHFHLAIAYIELGRESDAVAEAAEVLRINPEFVLGDPKTWPIKDLALPERWTADLRKAGLK